MSAINASANAVFRKMSWQHDAPRHMRQTTWDCTGGGIGTVAADRMCGLSMERFGPARSVDLAVGSLLGYMLAYGLIQVAHIDRLSVLDTLGDDRQRKVEKARASEAHRGMAPL